LPQVLPVARRFSLTVCHPSSMVRAVANPISRLVRPRDRRCAEDQWRRAGMGKRGGLRVIYFWEAKSETFYMLTMYRKSKQEELSPGQLRILRRLVAEEFK
jgi:hypothetical protein